MQGPPLVCLASVFQLEPGFPQPPRSVWRALGRAAVCFIDGLFIDSRLIREVGYVLCCYATRRVTGIENKLSVQFVKH